jgi:plasmid stabilization system protein ParE
MARISYAFQALADLERISDFLVEMGQDALAVLDLIDEAVSILPRHPFIGRQVEDGLRELVMSQGRTGHVALYSVEAEYDAILVLAIRHQREAGWNVHKPATSTAAPPSDIPLRQTAMRTSPMPAR